MAGAASAIVEDEWELCNDDGFIYKRRKRAQLDEGKHFASQSTLPHATDPETELKRNRVTRTKLSLLALRDRYRREIEQWEDLIASLQNGDLSASDSHNAVDGGCGFLHSAGEGTAGRHDVTTGATSVCLDCPDKIAAPENPFHALLLELISQVETHGTLLKKLSGICDVVDSACDLREEVITESLIDLTVWGSPRSLMSSLIGDSANVG